MKSCPDDDSKRAALIECLAPNRRVVVEVQGTPQIARTRASSSAPAGSFRSSRRARCWRTTPSRSRGRQDRGSPPSSPRRARDASRITQQLRPRNHCPDAGAGQRAYARGDVAACAASPTTCRSCAGSRSTSGRPRRSTCRREFVRDGTLLACAEMLRGGITCFNDMYFFPDASLEAALAAGMRSAQGMIVIEFPSAYASDAADYLRQRPRGARPESRRAARFVLPRAARALHGLRRDLQQDRDARGRARPAGPHPPARDARTRSSARSPSTACARSSACARLRPARPGSDRGARGAPRATQEIELLAQPRRVGGALPFVEPQARERLRAGRRAADAQASTSRSAPTARRATTASTCSRKCAPPRCSRRRSRDDAQAMPAHAALRAATLWRRAGARHRERHGLDRARQGRRPGRGRTAADPSSRPATTSVSHLVYAAGRENVSHVWVGGEPLMREREHRSIRRSPAWRARWQLWQNAVKKHADS